MHNRIIHKVHNSVKVGSFKYFQSCRNGHQSIIRWIQASVTRKNCQMSIKVAQKIPWSGTGHRTGSCLDQIDLWYQDSSYFRLKNCAKFSGRQACSEWKFGPERRRGRRISGCSGQGPGQIREIARRPQDHVSRGQVSREQVQPEDG